MRCWPTRRCGGCISARTSGSEGRSVSVRGGQARGAAGSARLRSLRVRGDYVSPNARFAKRSPRRSAAASASVRDSPLTSRLTLIGRRAALPVAPVKIRFQATIAPLRHVEAHKIPRLTVAITVAQRAVVRDRCSASEREPGHVRAEIIRARPGGRTVPERSRRAGIASSPQFEGTSLLVAEPTPLGSRFVAASSATRAPNL